MHDYSEMNKLLFFLLFWISPLNLAAQSSTIIQGQTTYNTVPLADVEIYFNSTLIGLSDSTGTYKINVPVSNSPIHLVFSHPTLGTIEQANIQKTILNIEFNQARKELDELVIKSKSSTERIASSAYAVTVLETKQFHNSSVDLAQVLDKSAGIKVLQKGGMGSDVDLSLNGFTGNRVKIFMDGLPLESYGPTFQLNNIPVQQIERIEIYKGVVPPQFATDALGGVINIVTQKSHKPQLNASYAIGSFNTHKLYANAQVRTPKDLVFSISSYTNYSDNDYIVKAKVLDFETGTYSKNKQKVKRFHDLYRNQALNIKAGVENKSFADELYITFAYGKLYDQIQHAADMDKVFGEKYRTAETVIPGIFFKKTNLFTADLSLTLQAHYNFGTSTNKDLSQFQYNWLGERTTANTPGEQRYADYRFKNNDGLYKMDISYTLNDAHRFYLNHTLTSFNRKGHDQFREFLTKLPTKTTKNVLGISYLYQPTEKWNTTLFYKKYYNHIVAYYTSQDQQNTGEFTNKIQTDGYGIATTYTLANAWQFKVSFEKAIRLPSSRELFGIGDGIEEQNVNLKPERSDNINTGIRYMHQFFGENQLTIEVNYANRKAKDFINKRNRNGVFYAENFGQVHIHAIDMDLRYTTQRWFSAGTNFTWQNIINKQKYSIEEGQAKEDYFYKERLPNIPYFFAHADINFYISQITTPTDKLALSLFANYTASFTNDWDIYKSSNEIPQQLTFDFSLNYAFQNGKYNVSAECFNLFDIDRYDNYNLQKPGRHFALKINMLFN